MTERGDMIDVMTARLRAERSDDEPLYVTAARVFYDGIDYLSEIEMTALEATGFTAVEREGEPSEIRVPSVVRMIDAGQPFDHVAVDPEDRPKLMFLGFLSIAAETLMAEEEQP